MKAFNKTRDNLLTTKQAAEYLNMSVNTLYKLVGKGKIAVTRLNRSLRFPREILDQWIKENTVMPI